MTLIADAAAKLREAANNLEKLNDVIAVAPTDPTIQSATVFLRTLLGKSVYFSLELHVDCYSGDSGPEVIWKVYDGKTHHDAKTLAAALRLTAAKARAKQGETTLSQAQAAIGEGLPMTPTEVETMVNATL